MSNSLQTGLLPLCQQIKGTYWKNSLAKGRRSRAIIGNTRVRDFGGAYSIGGAKNARSHVANVFPNDSRTNWPLTL